jgi:hypothetical protein
VRKVEIWLIAVIYLVVGIGMAASISLNTTGRSAREMLGIVLGWLPLLVARAWEWRFHSERADRLANWILGL